MSLLRILALVLLVVVVDARADVWTDCVLYDTAQPEIAAMFREEAAAGATVVEDLSLFWLAPEVLAAIESGAKFVGVCRYVEPYQLPRPDHCVHRNLDYRFDRAVQRWVYDVGWNTDGAGEWQCWYEAGWHVRLGYWGESGTPEAGEWIAYPHPCADYRRRMEAGESLRPEPSCEPYLWGGE